MCFPVTIGGGFNPKHSKAPGLYCSYACRGLADRQERVITGKYIRVYMPEHPNSSSQGYVLEHRLIMSKLMERPLRAGEVVHHKDGNKRNNSIDNLELMSDSEHKSLHTAGGPRANGKYAARS